MHQVDLIIFELNDAAKALASTYHPGAVAHEWPLWTFEYGPGSADVVDRVFDYVRCTFRCVSSCCGLFAPRQISLRRVRIVRVRESPWQYHADLRTGTEALFGDGRHDALAAIIAVHSISDRSRLLNFILLRLQLISTMAPPIPIAIMVELGCISADAGTQPCLEALVRDQMTSVPVGPIKCFKLFLYTKNPDHRIRDVHRYLYRNLQ